MRMRWSCLVLLLLLLGCEHATDLPPVPPPPEDLSTWVVPELVQPPPPVPPDPVMVKEKGTAAERVYDFTPGATFAATVSVGWPLDIVLERGEQVRNIV